MRLPVITSREWRCISLLLISTALPQLTVAAGPERSLSALVRPPARIAVNDGAWVELFPAATPPSARAYPAAIYDPVRDRMLVFGGAVGGNQNDVWELSLAGSPAWSLITPAGTPPSGRFLHTAIYDPVRDRMLVFGGFDSGYLNDVWELSLAGSPTWSLLTPTGTPPSARGKHTAIYDPVRDRMVVFGGFDAGGLRNDVWALSLERNPAWSAITHVGSPPSARAAHSAFYDPLRDGMVVFGGADAVDFRNDAWTLSLAVSPQWSLLEPGGDLPSAREYTPAIYDPARDRLALYAGYGSGGIVNDTWQLSLVGTPTWSELTLAGGLPQPRFAHAAIYDPVRDRMLVFGGDDGVGYRNDLWAQVWGSLVAVPGDARARGFEFAIPRPNPSRGEATVDFELTGPGRVALDVFDTHGRRLERIADGWLTAGRHVALWRGVDASGHALESGVYFMRMTVGGVQRTRRIVRIR